MRPACMRSTLPSKFRYNVWKSRFVLITKLDIKFELVIEKDWKWADRVCLQSINIRFRTWWSDLRIKWMYDKVRGGSEWWRSVGDKHWKHGESRCCVYPLFRQSPQMQAQHHHVGGITPAPCAWNKQRQVELLDNRAFSENRPRARVRTIFSRYVSCYANLKLTTLWPFVTSKNEKSNNSRDLSQCPRFAAPIQKRPKSRS